MKNIIPTFQFVIDDSEESGVKAISIVGDPAFQSSMITFSKEQPKFVTLANKKKQICAGLSLIPDVPIFRSDPFYGEYYGFFSKETIEKIVEKYHYEMNSNKLNLDHNEDAFIDAFMVEDYIVNTEARVEDLKSKGIEHENIMGAWYTAFKIKDKNVFEQIESGEVGTGFSVEAFLDKIIVQMNKNNNFNMKKDKKTLLEKIIAIFSTEETFERALVGELGFSIEWSEVGAPVNKITVDTEGVETLEPVGVGEFITDAGVIVVDESSNLLEVRELPVEEPVVEEPVVEAPVEEPMAEGDPVIEEPVVEAPVEEAPIEEPSADVKIKTIGEIVGDVDGEYYIKVVVSGGAVTEAEVSSETNLLKASVDALLAKNTELLAKLEEPIGDPIIQAEVEVKPFNQMSAYEKAMQKANARRS